MILGSSILYKPSNLSTNYNIKTADENKSLFVESLDMLLENNRFFDETLKRAHTNVLLSESSRKSEVYLSEFSIIETIKNIIDFFVNLIKSLFAKFKTMIQKITYSDKTIEKYEDKLKNMKGEFTVSFPRYIYTCSDTNIPNINLKTTFDLDYDDLQRRITEIADMETKAERCERMRVIESDIRSKVSGGEYYNSLRSKTIGKDKPIPSTEYPTELFNVFRDGGKETNSKVNNTEVTNILNRYTSHKKIINDVEKEKEGTIGAAKDIQKKIESITLQKSNKHYTPYDNEEEVLFNKILQAKSGQVNEACNIFVMAFSAKLDAIKESAIQDKKVLFEAIKFINMGGKE